METATESGADRRRSTRRKKNSPQALRISFEERLGHPRTEVVAAVLDVSENGCRIKTLRALAVGSLVYLDRQALIQDGKPEMWSARITWCSLESDGAYSAGLQLIAAAKRQDGKPAPPPVSALPDYYDLLQLSPKADPDTIHRVYRILAQRFHPDNTETGSEQIFRKLLEAYRVLSDPEKRAAYDVEYSRQNAHRWQIFDQHTAMHGIGSEKTKRTGILLVLYTRRVNEPALPQMTVLEIEELLGCPKEHLEFSLWFLREKGWIQRGDNARFQITANGVEAAEAAEIPWQPAGLFLNAPQAHPSPVTQ